MKHSSERAPVPTAADFVWIFLLAHAFVWAPNLVIDRLFCHGKMTRHLPSLALIEAVSIFFFAAKAIQTVRRAGQP